MSADLNERAMAGYIQITNINFKAKTQDLNIWKGEGWVVGVLAWVRTQVELFWVFFFFFLVLLPQSDGIVRLGVCECFIS